MRSRLLVVLILIPLFATGQLIYTPEFARRLMDKSRYEFAGWVIEKLSADTFAADEINYLRGLNYYKQQNFEQINFDQQQRRKFNVLLMLRRLYY